MVINVVNNVVSLVFNIVYVLGSYIKRISVVLVLNVIKKINEIIVIVWLFFILFKCIVICEKFNVFIVL